MKGRSVVKFFLVALLVTYPLFVFLALVVFELPISIVSIGMMIIAIAYFGFFGSKGKRNWSAIVLGILAIAVLITQSEIVLEFYPICLTLIFLFVFGIPLLRGRPIITRFAMMMDDAIETHPGRGILERCCKALNIVWCIHFIISLAINCMIVFGSTLRIWTLYNALISYLVQGLIIALQFPIVELANRKADRIILVRDVRPDFRPSDYVVGYYGDNYEYKNPANRTWKDLFSQPDASENSLWKFTVSLASALQAGQETGMDMDKLFYDEVLRLWEDAKTEENTFHLLPCPPKRRIIDLFRKLCAK
ncbi:MAG: hypothetical protein IKP61_04225 [Spirochaetales bacterium]|nr:hypothetical protein [Spirochaetales bacterium]